MTPTDPAHAREGAMSKYRLSTSIIVELTAEEVSALKAGMEVGEAEEFDAYFDSPDVQYSVEPEPVSTAPASSVGQAEVDVEAVFRRWWNEQGLEIRAYGYSEAYEIAERTYLAALATRTADVRREALEAAAAMCDELKFHRGWQIAERLRNLMDKPDGAARTGHGEVERLQDIILGVYSCTHKPTIPGCTRCQEAMRPIAEARMATLESAESAGDVCQNCGEPRIQSGACIKCLCEDWNTGSGESAGEGGGG